MQVTLSPMEVVMVQDLFLEPKSKKEQLFDYIKRQKWIKTSGVIKWGLENYHTRAERDARDLATEGRIKRMDDERKNFYFSYTKEDVWEYVGGE